MRYSFTRPAATSEQGIKEIAHDMDTRHKNANQEMTFHREPGFSKFMGWMAVICGALITYAICWGAKSIVDLESSMVGVQRDIAQLLSRPSGIPRDEYNRDMDHVYNDLADVKRQLNDRRQK